MSWLWFIPVAFIFAAIGYAAGRSIGEKNTEWEQEDHDRLAMAIGFMIATNQLTTPETVYYFIYQVLVDAKQEQL
jgi:hypothetical protein